MSSCSFRALMSRKEFSWWFNCAAPVMNRKVAFRCPCTDAADSRPDRTELYMDNIVALKSSDTSSPSPVDMLRFQCRADGSWLPPEDVRPFEVPFSSSAKADKLRRLVEKSLSSIWNSFAEVSGLGGGAKKYKPKKMTQMPLVKPTHIDAVM